MSRSIVEQGERGSEWDYDIKAVYLVAFLNFKRLSEIAEVASLTKEERRQYDESLRHYRDTIAVMHGQYLEGEEKGRAEGKAEVAKTMKESGACIEDIMRFTGLDEEQINRL